MSPSLWNTASLCFLLVWLFSLHSIAVFLFSDGFLLRRTALSNTSNCSNRRQWQEAVSSKQCWMDKRFDKIVIVIIDSLRLDFALFDERLPQLHTPHYRNKLPIIHELLSSSPEENDAHIFRFIADPPTTTMQRLKGLTTGSLPTFIDAGNNFASSAIAEDNWVTLARDNGLTSVMLGDDTWLSLFPQHFIREFGYNPFDVKDLHTVDNGVLKDLFTELKKPDWNVLLAHFEGVDHVGHRFGPSHPEMASKLSQMDGVLRDVVDLLDSSTLMIVMGDHGMTPSGDHGGDSIDEMNAALFAYSKQQRLWPQAKDVKAVSQIDLVPTISLLLGLPIPFSNLGFVIPELLSFGSNPRETLLRAMQLNAHQLSRYLNTYNTVSGDLPLGEYHQLKADFEMTERSFQSVMSNTVTADSELLLDHYRKYFEGVNAMCRSVWVKFDLVLMALGIVMLVFSLVPISFLLLAHLQLRSSMWVSVLVGVLVGSLFGIPLHFLLATKPSEGLGTFCCFGSALGSVVGFVWSQCTSSPLVRQTIISEWKPSQHWLPQVDNIFATLVLLIQCVGLLSNSYVLYEDSCISFLLISLYVIYFLTKASGSAISVIGASRKKVAGQTYDWTYFALFGLSVVVAGICSRTATHFQGCVEMKIGCERSSFLFSLSAAEPIIGSLKSPRYMFSCACVALIPAILWKILKSQGHLENFSPFHLCVSYGLPTIVVCIWIYWALQSLPASTLDQLLDWQHVMLPRIVYALTAVILVVLLIRPMAVRARITGFLPHLRAQSNPVTVELTGWNSVYVSPCLLLWVTVWLVLTLLQGDGLAPAMLLLALQAAFTVSAISLLTEQSGRRGEGVRWCEVVMWTTLSYHFFYSTGHQPVLSDLRFDAAFIGFRGTVEGVLPLALSALLVLLNTLTSQTLCILGLPVLLLVKQRGLVLGPTACSTEKADSTTRPVVRGPPRMPVNSGNLHLATFHLLLQYMLCHTFKLIAAAIMATVLRRHLMVWKVFAPRYLLELANFMYGEVLCLLMFAFVILLDRKLRAWLSNISRNYLFFIY